LFLSLCNPTVSARHYVIRLSVRHICSFVHLDHDVSYLMNGLNILCETYREYSQAHIDDLIRFWRSKVTVMGGRRGGIDINIDARSSKSILQRLRLELA